MSFGLKAEMVQKEQEVLMIFYVLAPLYAPYGQMLPLCYTKIGGRA